MRIVLPWPHKSLTPNAKRRAAGWWVYQPHAKADRQRGNDETLAQLSHGLRDVRHALKGTGKIALSITFYPPDRRKRDDDGAISAFKHMRDGICDALNVDDSRFRPSYSFEEPEKPGRVEVILTESPKNGQ